MANDTGPAADIAAIREVRAALERSVNELDADGIGRHLAEDVAQLPADGQARGRAAAVEDHRRVFDSFAEVSDRYTIEQIVVVGDLAVEWGTYDITVTDAVTAARPVREPPCPTCSPTSGTAGTGGSSA